MAAWPYPFWIAHRGAGKLAPENTLAAFRLGAQHGYRAFECDVKLSADEVPFLLHDATLERTTSGCGTAGDLPFSALAKLDAGAWHSHRHAGEPLPTLADIAAFVQAQGCLLNIEIKPTPGHEARTGEVVAQQVRRLWPAPAVPPLLSSFRPDALQAAQAAAAELPRALLLDTLWEGWLDIAKGLQCVAVVTNHKLMDAALISTLHAAGLKALVYTVNDAQRARELRALGIDGLVTDAVDQFDPAAG